MEQIKEIRKWTGEGYSEPEGFEVVTDAQTVRLWMDMAQDCCEQPGYFWCNDDTSVFVGARLREITITDTALNTEKYDSEIDGDLDCGGVLFVNLETDRGTLQFVAYNAHNGYYGHSAHVESVQLQYETGL